MKPFFITGLPRSRTAWLSNLLTWSDSFCFHEGLDGCASIDDFRKLLESAPKFTRHVGDSDPALGLVAPSVLEAFPDCRMVLVHRKLDDCVESEWKAIQSENNAAFSSATKDSLYQLLHHTSKGLSYFWNQLAPERKLLIPYNALDDRQIVEEIWNFCIPNTDFPAQRYEMLQDLRITQIFTKVLKRHPDQPFRKLIEKNEALLEKPAVVGNGI